MKPENKVEWLVPRDPELDNMIGKAQETLDFILRRETTSVRSDWAIKPDGKGRTVVALRLTDLTRGLSVSREFGPDDLRDADRLRDRLRKLWGDLLHCQIEQIGQELKSILASEGISP